VKIILRVQLVTDWGEVNEFDVAEFSRPARALNEASLGLSLTDGKALLQRLQQTIAGAQADELCELHRVCQRCHRWNPSSGVEKWRGRCRSEACLLPGLSVAGAQVAVPCPRFHFPLIEPNGRS
jgi:uncharacterized protein with von Willebrand factor type A (vWA) domain